MKKILIIIIVVVVIMLGIGLYFLFSQKNSQSNNETTTSQLGELPSPIVNSSTPSDLPDYAGQAADIYSGFPTSTSLSIGTAKGTVQVNNFYLSNPPVDDSGDIVIKQTANYVISYDPIDSSFWIGISSVPFSTWQSPAEQDFLATIGVSETDACQLSVTEGIVYSANNPDDGMSFPLSFCSGGAF